MGTNIGDIFVKLSLDMETFSKGLQDAKKEVEDIAGGIGDAGGKAGDGWTKGLEKAGKSMEEFGKNVEKIGMSMSLAITAPLAGITAASITAFAGFESSMNKVQALGDIFGKDLEKLKAQAMDLGAKTQYSAKQAADAMGNLAAAGFKTNEIFAAMPGVLNLAATEQMAIADAAQITSDILKGYGIAVSDTQKIADVLAKTSSSSATSVKELGFAFSYVGSVASTLKVPFLDTAAALGVLADAGIRGERGGTALRNIFNDLVAPSKAGAEALARLKINVTDVKGELLPLSQLFKNLGPLLKDVTSAQAVFGQRWSEVVPLIKDAGAAFNKTRKEIEDFNGAADKQASIMRQGLAGGWEQFTSQIEGMAIKIGMILAPTAVRFMKFAGEIMTGVEKMIDSFNKLPLATQDLVLTILGIAAAAGPVIYAVGAIATSFGGLQVAVAGLGEAIGGAGLLASFSALELAAGALLAVLVAFELKDMVNSLLEMKKAMDDNTQVYRDLQSLGLALVDMFKALHPEIGWLSDGLTILAKQFGGSGDTILWFKDLLLGLWDAFRMNTLDFILGPLGLVAAALREAADQFKRFAAIHKQEVDDMSTGLKNLQKINADSMRQQADDAMKFVTVLTGVEKQRQALEAQRAKSAKDLKAEQAAARKEAAAARKEARDAEKEERDYQKEKAAFIKVANEMDKQHHLALVAFAKEAYKIDLDTIALWKQKTDAQTSLTAAQKQLNDSVTAGLKEATDKVQALDAAYKTLGITSIDALVKKRDEAKAAFDLINEAYKAHDPAASYTVALEASLKVLETEKELAIARKGNWQIFDDQIKSTKEKLGELGVKGQENNEIFKALGTQISTIMTDLGKDITDAILKGKDLGDVFVNAFASMGKAVLRFAVEYLQKQLLKAILGNKDAFKGLESAISSAFKSLQKLFTGGASAAANAVDPVTGVATKAVTDPGGLMGSANAVKSGVGGLTGAITMVSSAVSAVTGVLQYLQGRRMEQDIGRIEVTSREIKAELSNLRADEWTREQHLYAMKDQIVGEMQRYGDITGRFLSDILGNLQLAVEILRSGVTLNGSSSGDGGGSSLPPAVQAPITDFINAVNIANQATNDATFANMVNSNAVDMNTGAFNSSTSTVSGATDAVDELGNAASTTATEVKNTGKDYSDKIGKTIAELEKLDYKISDTTLVMEDGSKIFADWTNQIAYVVDATGKVTAVQEKTKDQMAELSYAMNKANDKVKTFSGTIQSSGSSVSSSLVSGSNSVAASIGYFSDTVTESANQAATAMKEMVSASIGPAVEAISAATWNSVDLLQAEMDRVKKSIGLTSDINNSISSLQKRIDALTPSGTAPAGMGPTNPTSTYWSGGYSGISSTPISMTVNVNNADAGQVANTMISTFRARGVDI